MTVRASSFASPRASRAPRNLTALVVFSETGTTTELNLADSFRASKISYKPVPIESNEEARKNYLADRCDALYHGRFRFGGHASHVHQARRGLDPSR